MGENRTEKERKKRQVIDHVLVRDSDQSRTQTSWTQAPRRVPLGLGTKRGGVRFDISFSCEDDQLQDTRGKMTERATFRLPLLSARISATN